MESTRRKFLGTAFMGGLAAAIPSSSKASAKKHNADNPRYAKLDAALKKPVFKKELFSSPVIIETLELLRYKDKFICRVRSKDGAEGYSFGQDNQFKSVWPVFTNRLQPFFIGKDARDLEDLLEQATVYESNYKLQGIAIWVPLATIEFAILDMLGIMVKKSIGELIGTVRTNKIHVYQANSERDISAELTIEHLKEELAKTKAKAIKFKLGGRMSHTEYPAGRSEKLIPLVRKTFGDQMVISADANGSYDVKEAIRIGKIMEAYKYDFYEEPVPFDWYEETKQVADAVNIPIAGGEQEPSMHNFRWLLANDGLQIVQADMFYFGGMVRCVRVARMAEALGKLHIPHVSSIGYIYMMHFISVIPNAGPYHEYKSFKLDFPFECKTSSLVPEDGVVTVPTGPGMGIIIDPDYVKKHEVLKG
ncbi:MAG: mandelate racemase/muconate lactonizing enzyme family protein [Williamsia sp.]|nr:mandelate racemase/muconate lactonizing enzyme family protein [Williamsia sp.]